MKIKILRKQLPMRKKMRVKIKILTYITIIFLGIGLLYYQSLTVILSHGIKNIKTNALLDSGSDITLISREVRSKLELNGVQKKLNIHHALSKASEITSETETISISSECSAFDSSVDAYVVDKLNISPNKVNIADLKGKYPHLQNIYFPLLQDSKVTILTGTDHADVLPHKEFRKWNLNEPVAVRSSLG